jgi:hypothetical protein
MSVEWISGIAGTEVTVGEGPGDGEMTGIGAATPSLDMTMTWLPRQSPHGSRELVEKCV